MKKWMGLALTVCLLLSGCGGGKTERLPVKEPSAKEAEPQTEEPAVRRCPSEWTSWPGWM